MKLYGARRASERAAMKAEYEAGASIRTIASTHGHSYGYVHDALIATGTQLHSRGGPNNPYPFRRRANRGSAPH
ncbi:helix-turn-helix domain-containing protein [Mycobacteroides abscessus]|uniref:helix-turn-helix domain-containing protein n=1 Tax=Mycobacteroides abscessus TaxID=36809 RepID=UPI000C262D08|nr:helix-turn-helix domain-containing protein [Mycobacteroides abscessus]